MQNNFMLALIAMIRLEDRRNSQLFLLTSEQIITIISQPKYYPHLSEAP